MTFRKYLVLAGVTLFAAIGDTFLARGMKQVGNISLHNLPDLVFTILDPWVALGILFLLAFFAAYMTALSWADLTYVLPATSLGYVLLALIAKFFLHEQVTHPALGRHWPHLGWSRVRHPGPGLDSPSRSSEHVGERTGACRLEGRAMKHAYTWGAILVVVLASTTGDVLAVARHEESGRRRRTVAAHRTGHGGVAHPAASQLHAGHFHDGGSILQPAVRPVLGGREPGGARPPLPSPSSPTPSPRRFSCTNASITAAGSPPCWWPAASSCWRPRTLPPASPIGPSPSVLKGCLIACFTFLLRY